MNSRNKAATPPRRSDQRGRTRVLCVDDSLGVTEALRMLIEMEPDLEVAGILHCADDLVGHVRRLQAAVVVLDLSMPGLDPLQAIRDLASRVPVCRVIAFSGYPDPDTRAAALAAGAADFMSKGAPLENLAQTIRRVCPTTTAGGRDRVGEA